MRGVGKDGGKEVIKESGRVGGGRRKETDARIKTEIMEGRW